MANLIETVYLQNVKRNLADSTRHTSLDANRKIFIAPRFHLLAVPTPYVVLHPLTSPVEYRGSIKRKTFRFALSLAWQRFHSPSGEDVLLGDSSLDGPLTELQEYEDALVRAYPYNDGTHISGTGNYVTQAGVQSTYPVQVMEPAIEVEYDIAGELTGMWAIAFREIFEAAIVRS